MIAFRLLPAFALLVSVAACQSPSLIADGADGKTLKVTMADLSKLPQHTINATEHKTPATFEGVLLSDLLAKVDVPSGEKLRGKLMAMYVIVEAADGYRAVFALPELDTGFTDRKVYLVTKRDGKALSEKEGHSASWLRMRSAPLAGCGKYQRSESGRRTKPALISGS
jgi:hypothetical protein